MLFDMPCSSTVLSPIIKWAGGKEKELPHILSNSPTDFECYYEPFVGGGSVYAAFAARRYFINDKCSELINLYRSIAAQDRGFFGWMDDIVLAWRNMQQYVDGHREWQALYMRFREEEVGADTIGNMLEERLTADADALWAVLPPSLRLCPEVYRGELRRNVVRKVARMTDLERKKHRLPEKDVYSNIETAFLSVLYMYFRHLYNHAGRLALEPALTTALFVFLRNYAYSGMFRYNDKGEFNVPYGGIAYNSKSLSKKLDYYRSEALSRHLRDTVIGNMDFEDFFREYPPTERDFVFLDPPYDSEFSTYAQNAFTKDDHLRLARYLCEQCPARWMLVIKATPFISSLYDRPGLRIKAFDKKYLVSFMNRNNKEAQHLLITNY